MHLSLRSTGKCTLDQILGAFKHSHPPAPPAEWNMHSVTVNDSRGLCSTFTRLNPIITPRHGCSRHSDFHFYSCLWEASDLEALPPVSLRVFWGSGICTVDCVSDTFRSLPFIHPPTQFPCNVGVDSKPGVFFSSHQNTDRRETTACKTHCKKDVAY